MCFLGCLRTRSKANALVKIGGNRYGGGLACQCPNLREAKMVGIRQLIGG